MPKHSPSIINITSLDVDGTITSDFLDTEANTGALHTLKNTTANAAAFSQWYNHNDTVRLIIGIDGSGFSGVSGQAGIGTWTSHPLVFFVSQGERARLNTAFNAGIFIISTTEPTVVDGDLLGRLDFQANSESSGGDALLVGASIWAEADDTLAADNNTTDLVFATAVSETAVEKMRLTSTGQLGVGVEPNSKLHVGGSLALDRTASAANVNSGDETIIGITDTTAARTVTLRSADTVAGRVYHVKDESGGAGTNNITIATEGSETIDGAASIAIVNNYGSTGLYCDGSNWFTFAKLTGP